MPKKAKSTRRKKRVSTTAKISHQLTKIKEETRKLTGLSENTKKKAIGLIHDASNLIFFGE
jgi:hypothetical protein